MTDANDGYVVVVVVVVVVVEVAQKDLQFAVFDC